MAVERICFPKTETVTLSRTSASRRRVDEAGVPAIIGPAASSITLEVFNEVAKPAGVLVITPSGTSAALTNQADDDLLWRTVPSDAIQGAAVAAHILAEGFAKVAVINRDDTYGQGLRGVIQADLCAADRCGEMQYFSRAYPEDGGFEAQAALISPLREFAPDVIVLVAFLDDGAQFMTLAGLAGFERFILTDGVKDAAALDSVESERLLRDAVGTAPAALPEKLGEHGVLPGTIGIRHQGSHAESLEVSRNRKPGQIAEGRIDIHELH